MQYTVQLEPLMIIDSPKRREHLLAIASRLPEHVARLGWSGEQLARERQVLLRETVAWAKSRSPWHADRLADIDPETMTEDTLRRIPVMTKYDVMANWDAIVTDRRLTLEGCNAHIQDKLRGRTKDYYYLDDCEVFATGGSSGSRGVFVWGWNEFIEIACVTFRYQYRDESMHFSSGRRVLAVIEAGEIVHGSPFLFSVTPQPDAEIHWFPAQTPTPQLVDELNRTQPTHINCFASSLQELAGEALSGRLKIRPRHIATNSEPLMPEAREAARKAWGLEINNMWGCVEVGHVGIECDRHEGMHMSDDAVITEFVDEDDRPTGDPDKIAKVLVTSLFNRVQPIIRYELTDIAIPSVKPCSCGAAFPLIREVKGRSDDAFRYPGGVSVHPLVFRTPLGQHPMIEQYQVQQTPNGATIRIVGRGEMDLRLLKSDLVAALEASGLKKPEIEIDVLETIPRHAETGKLKRFIPLKH